MEGFDERFFHCLFSFMLKNEKSQTTLLDVSIFFVTSLYSQDKVTIAVFDTQGNALSYPEIILGTYLHRIGQKKGH